jgi:ribosomal-protein-alanine N-acetyltransferase
VIEERLGTDPPQAAEVRVRPMRGSDIERVSRIERRSFSVPWNTQAYVTEIANPSASYLVATVEDHVVGYGGLWVIMDEAHITTIAVDPEFRGRHIGERLLAEMLVAAQKKGATRATLEVREHNEVAQRLYEKYGFAWVALRRGYYSDNNENAVIMWIDDMNNPDWRRRFAALRAGLGLPPAFRAPRLPATLFQRPPRHRGRPRRRPLSASRSPPTGSGCRSPAGARAGCARLR